MSNSELYSEKIDSFYQQLAENKLIAFAFLSSIAWRVLVPIFLPKITNTPLSAVLEITYIVSVVVLPTVEFFRFKKEAISNILNGSLSIQKALLLGCIIGIILILIRYFVIATILPVSALGDILKVATHESLRDVFIFLCQVLYLILGSFSEEIIFQGWLQTKLSKNIGPIKGALLTTLVFQLCHLTVSPFAFISLLLFAIIRMKTKSLLCCTVAHVLSNFGISGIGIMFGILKH